LAVKGFTEDTLKVRRVYLEIFLNWCTTHKLTEPAEITKTSLEGY